MEIIDEAPSGRSSFHRAEAVSAVRVEFYMDGAHRGSIILLHAMCSTPCYLWPSSPHGNNYTVDSFKQLYPIGRLDNSPLAQLATEKEYALELYSAYIGGLLQVSAAILKSIKHVGLLACHSFGDHGVFRRRLSDREHSSHL